MSASTSGWPELRSGVRCADTAWAWPRIWQDVCCAPRVLLEETCLMQLFIPSCIFELPFPPSHEYPFPFAKAVYEWKHQLVFDVCGCFLRSRRCLDPSLSCPLRNRQMQAASCHRSPCPPPAVLCTAYSSYLHWVTWLLENCLFATCKLFKRKPVSQSPAECAFNREGFHWWFWAANTDNCSCQRSVGRVKYLKIFLYVNLCELAFGKLFWKNLSFCSVSISFPGLPWQLRPSSQDRQQCPWACRLSLWLAPSSSSRLKPRKLLGAWLCLIWGASPLCRSGCLRAPRPECAHHAVLEAVTVGAAPVWGPPASWCLSEADASSPLLIIVTHVCRGNILFCLWKTLRMFSVNKSNIRSCREVKPLLRELLLREVVLSVFMPVLLNSVGSLL